MKVASVVVLQMTDDPAEYIELLRVEEEYSGPVALCDRGQSKAVANQGMQQSAQDQANAQTAFGGSTAAIDNFNKSVAGYNAANPYGIGGQYDQAMKTISADTSNAGTASLSDAMARNAKATGQNAASYAPALAEAQRAASRNLATSEAQSEESREANDAKYRAQGVQFASMSPDMYSRLYGTGTSGASSNLNPAASAASRPGFLDTLGTSFAQGLGSGAAAGLVGG